MKKLRATRVALTLGWRWPEEFVEWNFGMCPALHLYLYGNWMVGVLGFWIEVTFFRGES